jgi:hypothetical protein
METTSHRGRRIDPDIEAEIRKLVLEGWTPPQIERHLSSKEDFADRVPDIRTIRRRVAWYWPEDSRGDTSGPWTWADADGEEAALVLPVLGAVLDHTQGRIAGFTKNQARWVLKVRRAAPDLDPWYVWRVAAAYQLAVQKGTEADRDSLDALLAFAPWRSQEAMDRFVRWAQQRRPNWLFTRQPDVVVGGRTAISGVILGSAVGLSIALDIVVELERALRSEESNESPRKP